MYEWNRKDTCCECRKRSASDYNMTWKQNSQPYDRWKWMTLRRVTNDIQRWEMITGYYFLSTSSEWKLKRNETSTVHSIIRLFVRSYMKCHKIFGIKECELKEYKYIPIYSIWSSHVPRVSLQNGLQNSNGQCVCMLGVCVSSCSYFT